MAEPVEQRADLTEAGLGHADLTGAYLGFANLTKADLQGAKLDEAGHLTRRMILIASDWRGATLPDKDLELPLTASEEELENLRTKALKELEKPEDESSNKHYGTHDNERRQTR